VKSFFPPKHQNFLSLFAVAHNLFGAKLRPSFRGSGAFSPHPRIKVGILFVSQCQQAQIDGQRCGVRDFPEFDAASTLNQVFATWHFLGTHFLRHRCYDFKKYFRRKKRRKKLAFFTQTKVKLFSYLTICSIGF
jgi:hypothetical protein